MLTVNGQWHTPAPLTLANLADVPRTILSRVRGPGNLWIPTFRELSAPGFTVKCE